jgi:hypothetical protein
MDKVIRAGARADASYAQAVFGVLGAVSLAAWLLSVVTSRHHHPLTYWLVVGLALLLVASLIWGARRSSPRSDGVHIRVGRDVIINQVYPGQTPPGAPEAPGDREDL